MKKFTVPCFLAAILSTCVGSRSDAQHAPSSRRLTSQPAPFAAAPANWDEFLSWADRELNKSVAPVQIPSRPRLARSKWPLVRLDDQMNTAKVRSEWSAPKAGEN